jgi:hypothetical protein
MKTILIIIAIFYVVYFAWFIYEIKHAPLLSDEDILKMDGFTQEEIDKLLNNRGQRGN